MCRTVLITRLLLKTLTTIRVFFVVNLKRINVWFFSINNNFFKIILSLVYWRFTEKKTFVGNHKLEIKKRPLYGIYRLSSNIFDDRCFFLSVVCDVLANGVTGVFGPAAGDTAPIVQSICDYKEIPHIQTRWDINQKHGLCQINLYPHPSTLAKVVTETKHCYSVSARNSVIILLLRDADDRMETQ